MLLSYKPLHLEAQEHLQEDGCVVDIKVPSPAMLDFIDSNQNSHVNGPPLELADPLPAAANSSAFNKRKKNNAHWMLMISDAAVVLLD